VGVAKYVNSVSKAGMTTGATTGRHTDRHVWTPFNLWVWVGFDNAKYCTNRMDIYKALSNG